MNPSAMQAGGHPSVTYNVNPDATLADGSNGDDLKKVVLDFPAGALGNPEAANPKCTTTLFNQDKCPSSSYIGSMSTKLRLKSGTKYITVNAPGSVYVLSPPTAGSAITVGFIVRPPGYRLLFMKTEVTGVVKVRSGTEADYGITLEVDNIPRLLTTTWGASVPATAQDIYVYLNPRTNTNKTGPYFTFMPTRCDVANVRATISSYAGVSQNKTDSFTPTGCASVPFTPTSAYTPSSLVPGTPTGMSATFTVPTADATIQQSHVRTIQSDFPVGTGINWSEVAAVPVLCAEADLNNDACPAGSKIGTVSAVVPFLPPTMTGDVYLLTRGNNFQFGYILRGANGVKAPLKGLVAPIDADNDGTADFIRAMALNMPQAPWASSTINFTSPLLVQPIVCGVQTVLTKITGWSGAVVNTTNTYTTAPCGPTTPDTSITSGPAGPTNDTTPTFAFTSTVSGSTFECRVDADPFAACTTPFTTAALPEGAHTFEVRAKNGTETDATPATRSFVIDTTAPALSIVSPTAGATVASTSVTVTFSTEASATTTCAIDAGAATACNSPKSYAGLAQGPHTVTIVSTDTAGNASTATRSFTVDTVGPTVSITTPTEGQTLTVNSATVNFATGADAATVTCKLSTEAAASACTSPKTYAGLADGSYSVTVTATDAAGNATSAVRNFSVNTTPVDTTPPDTTINSGPSGLLNTTAASFTFSASETSTFQCALDAAAYSTCTSPLNYSGLSQGAHTFTVRATDTAGNVDPTPASRTWTVDTIAPVVTISSPTEGQTFATATVNVTFSSEAGAAFTCKVDSGAAAPCSSPFTTAALANGAHSVTVSATDAAGNTGSLVRNFNIGVDTTPPDTAITGGPSGLVNSASASFTFTSTEAGSTFACSIDGGAFGACTSPKAYAALAEGGHTFAVRATDAAGNTDPSDATRSFTVDTVAPDTSITGGPSGLTNSTSATYTFTGTETGSFQCSVDGGTYAVCSSPLSLTGLSQGAHSLSVRAIDAAGNVDASPATRSSTVDSIAPVVTISSPTEGSTSASATVSVVFSSEAGATSTCKVDSGAAVACSSPFSTGALANGAHSVTVAATDAAGNTGSLVRNFNIGVDVTPPDTTILSGPSGTVASTSASFTFSANETSTFQCSLDGAAAAPCTSPQNYTGLGQGNHTFSVVATDTAGNVDGSPATRTWTVDTVAPVVTITSPTEGQVLTTNTATITFATEAGASTTCQVDAGAQAACSSPFTTGTLTNAAHSVTVRATDAAGNIGTTVRNFTINNDTVAPDTTITSGPSGATASSSASFAFSATETSTFKCSLDGAVATTCTSPQNYTGLAEGNHTFSVVATDTAGNVDPSAATRAWSVDTVAPDTTITSGPSGNVASSTATFTFTATEAGTFQCSLDGAAYTTCTSPQTYSGLTVNTPHTFNVRGVDALGNTDASPATSTFTVDPTLFDTTITAGPSGTVASASASFSFTSTLAGSTFQCALDGAAFTTCTSPQAYSGLAQGSHTFQVRAVNGSQTDATPASRTWIVDTVGPAITIGTPAAGSTTGTSTTVTFTATDSTTPVTVTCSLDGAAASACSSPLNLAGLANGNHTITVNATDGAGNSSSAARTWAVDAVAPDTTIGGTPAAGAVTNSTTAAFTLTSTETGSTFQCSLDGAAYTSCTSPVNLTGLAEGSHTFSSRATDAVGNQDASPATRTWTVDTTAPNTTLTLTPSGTSASATFTSTEAGSTFQCSLDGAAYATCTSPVALSGLGQGSHTYNVRATDAAGNTDATPATSTWVVDTLPPDTTITGGPTAGSTVASTTASLTFTSTEAGTFQCSLDGAAYAACSSPVNLTGLGEGSHTFNVRASDAAGNQDASPASRQWTVDTVAPDTTITGGPAAGSTINVTTASITFTATETGTFQCSLDGAAYATCTSPVSLTGLAQGSHTFNVRASDAVGNQDATPASRTFSVDSVPPTLSITSPTEGATLATATVTVTFSAEAGSTTTCQVDAGAQNACTSPFTTPSLANGAHSVTVRATDAAGNTATVVRNFTVAVDTTAPVTTLAPSGPTGTVNASGATFTFSADEPSTFKCSLDGAASTSCTSPISYTGLAEGGHTFSVVATDTAGNADLTPATRTWTVDTVAPNTTITSSPAALTNSTSASFTFTSTEAGSSFQCQLDAAAYVACSSPQNYSGLADGSHTFNIRATDGAGNTDASPATFTWTVDATAPVLTISSPTEGQVLTTSAVSVVFTAPGATTTCKLNTEASASPCTSPKNYTLADNSYSETIVATDTAGNSTTVVRNFSVSTTPVPDTAVTGPGTSTSSLTPSFTLTATPAAGATFECSVDGGAYAACTSPFTPTLSDATTHRVQVRAVNGAGTDPTPASTYTYVDTRAFSSVACSVTVTTECNKVTPTTTQAAAHPDVTAVVAVRGAEDPASVTVTFPSGLNGALTAVTGAKCTIVQADAGTCPASSKIGTLTATGTFTTHGVVVATGDVYLTDEPNSTFAAGVALRLTVPNGLGDVYARGGVALINNGNNQQLVVSSIPRTTTTGNAFHLTSVNATLQGDPPGGTFPLITNPSNCPATPSNFVGTGTGYNGGVITAVNVPYPVTGCASVPFVPTINQTFSTMALAQPAFVNAAVTVGTPAPAAIQSSSIQNLVVLEPSLIGANYDAFSLLCPSSVAPAPTSIFNPSGCPASAKFGTMTINSPLLAAPVVGTVYLINKTPLPWFGVDINPSIPGNPVGVTIRLLGTTSLPQVDPSCDVNVDPFFCQSQIRIAFNSLPDVPVYSVDLSLNETTRQATYGFGGETVKMADACQPAEDARATFTPRSGTASVVKLQNFALAGC